VRRGTQFGKDCYRQRKHNGCQIFAIAYSQTLHKKSQNNCFWKCYGQKNRKWGI